MTSVEAIGLSQASSARRSEAPVIRSQEPDSGQPIEKSDRTGNQPPAPHVELPDRAVYARLSYNRDSKKVVIEILDPRSGDVVRQFPTEQLPDDIRALLSEAGSLIKASA